MRNKQTIETLIDAVAKALYEADPSWNTTSARREIATIAVKATLAALSESEELQIACGKALLDHYADNPYQTFHHEPSVAAVVLNHLTKLGDDNAVC